MISRLSYIAQLEGIEADKKALHIIVDQAQGGLRDAIGLLEQLTVDKKLTAEHVQKTLGLQNIESMEHLFEYIIVGNIEKGLEEISVLYESGNDLQQYIKNFLEFLRKQLIESVHGKKTLSTDRLLICLEYFQTAYEQTRLATIPQLPLEIAFIKSCCLPQTTSVVPSESGTPKIHAVPRPMAAHDDSKKTVSSLKSIENTPSPTTGGRMDDAMTPLQLAHVKTHWPQVFERVHSPIVKKSILGVQLLKTVGNTLTLGFDSSFHMEKVMTANNRNELEKTLSELLGMLVKINGEVIPVTSKADPYAPPISNHPPEDLASTVADIFEGEMA